MNLYDDAINYSNQSYKIALNFNDFHFIIMNALNLGKLNIKIGSYDKAIEYQLDALERENKLHKIKIPLNQAFPFEVLGTLNYKIGAYETVGMTSRISLSYVHTGCFFYDLSCLNFYCMKSSRD